MQVEFFNNGSVGYNQSEMVRHMGKLIHDRTIVLVRVHDWDEIEEGVKEHLWQSILKKFGGSGIDLQRGMILRCMKRLWQNWRGLMKRDDDINKRKSIKDALEKVPNHLTKEDWEWLVKEHYELDEVKLVRSRNSENRSSLTMPHLIGSMPFRQIVWEEMGGKNGNKSSIFEIFKKTRMRKCGTLEQEVADKYDEIINVERDNPSFSRFEVVEKVFGEQDHDHVVCFGFGMKPKDVRGPLPSREELVTTIREKERKTMI